MSLILAKVQTHELLSQDSLLSIHAFGPGNSTLSLGSWHVIVAEPEATNRLSTLDFIDLQDLFMLILTSFFIANSV
jgi:hypothetical protein